MSDAAQQTAGAATGPHPREDRPYDYIFELKNKVDRWLVLMLAAGALTTASYGFCAGMVPAPTPANAYHLGPRLVGMFLATAIAGAALGLGSLAGFLFGLPRALTNPEVRQLAGLGIAPDQRKSEPWGGADPAPGDRAARTVQPAIGGYAINTNLERISDWLTTIIVGVGLTQLTNLIPAIEAFGMRVDTVFAFGGRVFGIGGGLFFLIFGFLFSYISTRTKLTLIFTENERDATSIVSGHASAIKEAASQSPVAPPAGSPLATVGITPGIGQFGAGRPSEPSPVDQIALQTNLRDTQTPVQLLALANASARSGDYIKALVVYRDVIKTTAFDPRIWVDYAGVLGLNGEAELFVALLRDLKNRTTEAEIERAQSSYVTGLMTALQANLYNGRFDEAIRIGELLKAQEIGKTNAWPHVWLACAYGQRHASLGSGGVSDSGSVSDVLRDAARALASEQVSEAIALDPGLKPLLRKLYDKRHRGPVDTDDDLESLYPDPALDILLSDATPAADEALPAEGD